MLKYGFHSLVTRFLVFLAGLLIVAIAAIFIIERIVFIPILLDAENEQAGKELERIEGTLEQAHTSLMAQTRDWAHWDDTYQFIDGANPDYIETNFSREMFEDLHDQAMFFFDADRQPVWVAGIDPRSDAYSTCGRAEDQCLWARPAIDTLEPFLEAMPDSGTALRLADPWPALVAIAPVLQTDRSGPAVGWLVKVRLIDERLLTMLSEQTGLPVQISTASPGSVSDSLPSVNRKAEMLQASKPLATNSQGAMLALSTEIPRDRFQRASGIFRLFVTWTAGLLIVVIGLVLGLLYCLVIKPLGIFTRFTSRQHRVNPLLQGDHVGNVPRALLVRKDEFGTLARHAQTLITNQREQAQMLLDLSQHDPLTGLANRRLFDATLQQAITDNSGNGLAVMMVDIDHFKLYNDHYGHPEGDVCLAKVAEAMEQAFRHRGFLVARTGGEEFSILLPDTTGEQAREHAETLRKAIAQLAIPHADSPVKNVVTVSIGICSSVSTGQNSGSTLMRSADLALYQAKERGRNRVACFGEDATDITG